MWTQIVGSRGSTMEPLWQLPSLHCQRKGICFFSLCMSPSYSQDLNTVDPHRCTSLLLSFCSSPLIGSVHSHLRKWGKIHFRFCAREEPPALHPEPHILPWLSRVSHLKVKFLQIRVLFAFSLPSPFSPCSKRADGCQGRRWDFLGPLVFP